MNRRPRPLASGHPRRRVCRARAPRARAPRARPFEILLDDSRQDLDTLARFDEADRARALADQSREDFRGLGERRTPRAERLVGQGWVPHRDLPPRCRRVVAVDQLHILQARQALRELARVRDCRRRQQEARRGPVCRRDPSQAAQHVRDVRPENPAVDVRLVDHHHREVREQLAPGAVIREDPEVQHIRVAQHHVRAPADLRARLARRVAVVDRRSHPLAETERGERPCLVLRQCLRRIEVQRACPRVAAQHLQRRQVEAQRLARCRPRRHDRRPRPSRPQGALLMRVESLDAHAREAAEEIGVQLAGQVHETRRAGTLARLAHQPSIGAAVIQQCAPRVLHEFFGHGPLG